MLQTTVSTSDDHIQTVDIAEGPIELAKLHEHVLSRNARVEFTTGAANANAPTTVLISKHELDGLERALEILSATDDVRAMRSELAKLVARSGEPIAAVFTRPDDTSHNDAPRFRA
jgi:hypothetical protein